VVTIADPIDSRLDAAFDETITAVELAAANSRVARRPLAPAVC